MGWKTRRWIRDHTPRVDVLETVLAVVGVIFLAIAVFCTAQVILLAIRLTRDETFSTTGSEVGLKVWAIAFFGLAAVVAFAVAKWSVGDRIVGAVSRWVKARRQNPPDE